MRRIKGVRCYFIFILLCFIAVGIYYFYAVLHEKSAIRNVNTKVELLTDSLSVGKFKYYSIKRIWFKLKNIGEQPLVVSNAKTSCGCTAAKYDKKPIPRG